MTRRFKKFDSEDNLRVQLAEYLQRQYPGILYRFDLAADMKLTPGQAARHKKLHDQRGYPDLFIVAPMYKEQVADFYGLFIELKKDDVKLIRDKDAKKILKGETKLRKKGDWWDQHIEEQAEVLQYLKLNGYCATFAVGFDEAKDVIDKYLADYRLQLEHVREQAEAQNNEEAF